MNVYDPRLLPSYRHLAHPVVPPGRNHVTILMATRDGAAFLDAQLASISAQSHVDWSLVVSDDGSRDHTRTIVHRFAASNPWKSISLISGPERGFQRNFIHALTKAPSFARYAAFSDQDDYWLPHKLARAVEMLSGTEATRPSLYCGRTIVTDENLKPRSRSPLFRRGPSFENALVQSIAGGNTMVMNHAAIRLLQRAAERVGEVVSHDWWAYQIVSGAGGEVIYDAEPLVLYRQHSGNLVGSGNSARAKHRRIAMLLKGDMRRYADINISSLKRVRDLLSEESSEAIDRFDSARRSRLPRRLWKLGQSRIRRQTVAGSAALWGAAALGKL